MTAARFRKRLGSPEPREGGTVESTVARAAAGLALIMGALLWLGWDAGAAARVLAGVPLALSTLVALAFSGRALYTRSLLVAARLRWPAKGAIVVTSDSPRWRDHIETHWLPRLGDSVVLLNYSQRAHWDDSLPVQLWRAYCEGRRDYVPAVILLRGRRGPLIFGFYRWFDAARRGHPEGLQAMEARLFHELGVEPPSAQPG